MDFENLANLHKFGFVGGTRIADLQKSCVIEPNGPGVYLVVRDNNEPPVFLKESTGGHFGHRNPTVEVQRLERRWHEKPIVLYVGKAGGANNNSTLQSRLRAYMAFGLGHPVAHWGGRYIWQLEDAKELKIFWQHTQEEPLTVERGLLDYFCKLYGGLPFANLRR